MMKKLMTAAVVSVFAAPAFAQTSNVTLYGRANVGLDNFSSGGATRFSNTDIDRDLKSRFRVYDFASRLGVRGVEDLGNGLRAIFQIESGVNVDSGQGPSSGGAANVAGGGQGGQNNPSAGLLASRDSFVGLDGGFGRLTFGRQSIFWVNGTIMQTGANYVNSEVPLLNGASIGAVVGPAARQNNVVLYTTPTFGGFNLSLGWAPNRENAQGQTQTPATGITCAQNVNIPLGTTDPCQTNRTNGNIYGGTARWAGGPISAQFDYFVNRAASGNVAFAFPANAGGPSFSRAIGMKGLVGWTYLPGAQISAVVGQNRNNDSSNFALGDVKQLYWGVSWEHIFGNIQGLAQFGQQNRVSVANCPAPNPATPALGLGGAGSCDSANTRARSMMVGARYLMSKRTALYATYNKTWNQSRNYLEYSGGGYTSASGAPALGADPRIIGVGIIHNF